MPGMRRAFFYSLSVLEAIMICRAMVTGLILLILLIGCGPSVETRTDSSDVLFTGRWALDLPGGAGWLGVKIHDGEPSAEMLWYGGSVTPVSTVEMR